MTCLLLFVHLCTLLGECFISEDKMIPSQSISTTTTVISGGEIVLTMLELKPGSMIRGHLTVGMQLDISYCMFDHTLYHSVHPSLINTYISHTHSVTLTKYLNSLPSKCKHDKLKHNRYSSFAFRRQEKEKHSSYCQIYNYSSLKG